MLGVRRSLAGIRVTNPGQAVKPASEHDGLAVQGHSLSSILIRERTGGGHLLGTSLIIVFIVLISHPAVLKVGGLRVGIADIFPQKRHRLLRTIDDGQEPEGIFIIILDHPRPQVIQSVAVESAVSGRLKPGLVDQNIINERCRTPFGAPVIKGHDRFGIFIHLLVKPLIILLAQLPVTVAHNLNLPVGGGVEVIVQTFGLGFRDDGVKNGGHFFRAVGFASGGIFLPQVSQHKVVLCRVLTIIFSDKRDCGYRHKTKNRHHGGSYQHIGSHH